MKENARNGTDWLPGHERFARSSPLPVPNGVGTSRTTVSGILY